MGQIYIPGRGSKVSTLALDKTKETTNYSTFHMASNPEMYEPMRTNNFEFQVTGLNEKLANNNPYGVKGEGELYNAEEVIRVSVDGAFNPHFKQNPIAVKRGNSTLYYAGTPTFDSGTIKLKDYIGTNAKMALMAWQNLSYNVQTEKIGLASDYKLDCYIKEFSPDYICIRKWKLCGCWITGITESGFDASQGDTVNQIQATIQYDKAYPETDEITDSTTLSQMQSTQS